MEKLIRKPNIVIDLGTENTLIYSFEKGVIIEESSIVRTASQKNNTKSSDEFIDYLNGRYFTSPLQGGVIIELDKAVLLLKPILERVRSLREPVILAFAPMDSTEIERANLVKSLIDAGASDVVVIPEPWAAIIGTGIDIASLKAQMLIDIGAGITELAIIKDNQLVCTSAVRIACNDLYKAVQSIIIDRNNFSPYHSHIEKMINEIDGMFDSEVLSDDKVIEVEGMDIIKRRMSTIEIACQDILEAAGPIIVSILRMIETTVNSLSEKIISELMESGIHLTGGGSRIKSMRRLIGLKTGLETKIGKDPTHSVINGAIKMLECWEEQLWWKKFAWPL